MADFLQKKKAKAFAIQNTDFFYYFKKRYFACRNNTTDSF